MGASFLSEQKFLCHLLWPLGWKNLAYMKSYKSGMIFVWWGTGAIFQRHSEILFLAIVCPEIEYFNHNGVQCLSNAIFGQCFTHPMES